MVMPLWLMILNGLIPVVKGIVDIIRSHGPSDDASQIHKDMHAGVLASFEACHDGMCKVRDQAKEA